MFEQDSNPAARFRWFHWLWLIFFGAVYAAFVIPNWSEAYIDFGDGNYLYIATRIAQGAVVYRDILAPQPPCHLFVGALLVKIAGWIGLESPLYLVRGFSLFVHLATFLLIAGLARKSWGSARAGVIAGAIFIFLPINLWWSMGYESENLEILFLVLMIRFALNGRRASDLWAGIFGALAALTNLTAAPFLLVLAVFMLIRDWRRALWVIVPAAILAGVVTGGLEIWTGGAFLKNAVFNQVGTYPPGQFWSYTGRKLLNEGGDILWLEWLFVLFAIIGFHRFLHLSPLDTDARDGLGWFCAATLCSFFYVSKGGTEDYIFCLAGPAVAILGAGGWTLLKSIFKSDSGGDRGAGGPLKWMGCFLTFVFITGVFTAGPLRPIIRHYIRLWNQDAFELPDLPPGKLSVNGEPRSNVQQVKEWIEQYTKPGDTILSPPFYAFLTHRNIWGDYSEIFIWTIKDHNDRVAQNENGEGWSKTKAMAQAIENRELPLVIIEMDQTGRLPEVQAALEKSYQMILKEPYRTLNTRLGVYVPKN